MLAVILFGNTLPLPHVNASFKKAVSVALGHQRHEIGFAVKSKGGLFKNFGETQYRRPNVVKFLYCLTYSLLFRHMRKPSHSWIRRMHTSSCNKLGKKISCGLDREPVMKQLALDRVCFIKL